MTLALILIVELLLLAELMHRVDRMSAVVFCSIYIIVGQLQLSYHASSFFGHEFPPGNFGEFHYNTKRWLLFFFSVFIFLYVCSLGLRNRARQSSVGEEARRLLALPIIRHTYLILFIFLLIRILTIDLGTLWKNNQYLLINSKEALTFENGAVHLAKSLVGPVTLMACFVLGNDIVYRRTQRILIGLSLVLVSLLFSVASGSRSAALPPAAIGLSLLALGKPRHIFLATVFFLSGLWFFIVAQVARSTGEFGIARIPHFLSLIAEVGPDDLRRFTLGSFTQGFMITPDAVAQNPSYPLEYKLLSFSPFPSAIDGFDQIRAQAEVRLHAFVPMSAVGEAFGFGWAYVALYAATLAIALRANLRAANRKNPILFVSTSLVLTAMFISGFTYPMRNIYRSILLVIILLNFRAIFLPFAILFFGKRHRNRPRRRPSTPPLPTPEADHG